MAVNLDLPEQKIIFDDGAPNIISHPMRCVIAGKKN